MEILLFRIRLFFEDRWLDIRHSFRWLTSAQWRNYWRAHKIVEALHELREGSHEGKME